MPKPKLFDDDTPAKRPTPRAFEDKPAPVPRDRATVQEKRLGKKMGFRVTPGSGSRPWAHMKGDGQNDLFVYESKTTGRASFTLTRVMLSKVAQEAQKVGKDPLFLLSWEGERPPELAEDFIVVSADYFRQLLERANVQPP